MYKLPQKKNTLVEHFPVLSCPSSLHCLYNMLNLRCCIRSLTSYFKTQLSQGKDGRCSESQPPGSSWLLAKTQYGQNVATLQDWSWLPWKLTTYNADTYIVPSSQDKESNLLIILSQYFPFFSLGIITRICQGTTKFL